MRILFLHGWTSVPGGLKPSFLKEHGHVVLNPALPDEDFGESVRIAEVEPTEHPLAIEQRDGMTMNRVREIAGTLLHQ